MGVVAPGERKKRKKYLEISLKISATTYPKFFKKYSGPRR